MTAQTRNLSLAGIGLAAVATVGTFLALSTGVTRVAPGESVQTAINAAAADCGKPRVITLDAGQAYVENLRLPVNPCAEIVIQSTRAGELPEGQRVTPAHAPLLAKLQSTVPAESVIKTVAGAHGYKFIGVEISTANPSVVVYDLVRFGEGRPEQATVASVPRQLSIDRSWIHGFDTQDVQRGVSMNCADCEVVNSTVSEIHGVGFDTQAICAWNTTGPLRIINNYLDGAGENILIGGADPASIELIPSDIQIRRNTVVKPLSWKVGDPSYAGRHWTIKNLLELKNAKNVQIDGNTFTNNWTDGQAGIPILFTVRNQEGSAPYSIIANVSFTNNVVTNAQGGVNFLGTDNEKPSQRAQSALIANNVFDKITGPFITINGYPDVIVEHNTVLPTCNEGCNTTTLYGEPSERFALRDNVIDEKAYGLFGDGGTQGQAALDKYTPNASVTGNVIVHPYAPWPTGNQSVPALMISSDYRTPYTGKGADIDALLAAQSGSVVSVPTPQPTPSATATVTVTPTPLPSPSPTPTAVPVPSPSPSPKPSPTATVLPVCKSNQFVGNPPSCRCLTGMKGNSGKCR